MAELTDRDNPFEIKWERFPSPPVTVSSAPSGDSLPVEPAADTATRPAPEATRLHSQLLTFHYYGQRDEAPPSDAALLPALLYPYRDLPQLRHAYPLGILQEDTAPTVKSLAALFNDLAAAAAGESDSDRRFQHHLRQVELAVQTLAAQQPALHFSELFERAAEQILSSANLPLEKAELFRADLEKIQSQLHVSGEVILYDRQTPARLFDLALKAFWQRRCQEFQEELEALTRNLQDILTTDDNRSAKGISAEHLRAGTGTQTTEELDFDALSEILSGSQLGAPLCGERRVRLEKALHSLHSVKALYANAARRTEALPFSLEPVQNDCQEALDQYRSRAQVMADFFKSVRIARLESENHYRSEVHDAFFEHFDVTRLAEDERSLCPPVLLHLDASFSENPDKAALLELLAAPWPIKILLEIDDLCGCGEAGQTAVTPSWLAQTGLLGLASGNVFVLQSVLSNPTWIQAGMVAGMGYDGPALYSIYTGHFDPPGPLDGYLVAAAAEEARVFPAFIYDPGKGSTWAERFDIESNPQPEKPWPTGSFSYRNPDGEQSLVEMPFTPVDLFLAASRLQRDFWGVPPEKWHEQMVPLPAFLQLSAEQADRKIPYVTAVDAEGQVNRIVVFREMLSALHRYAQTWRHLQESGGIENSHALALLAQERARLDAARQRDKEALEKQYALELEKDVAALSQEIVGRIAAQLLSGSTAAVPLSVPPAEPVAAPAAEAAPEGDVAAPEGEDDDEAEEIVTFDDPYIDTPLCTSCNDCTNINARMFAYDDNKQAYIKDPLAGPYEHLVRAAEKCPVHIIHPGKPQNPDESDLDKLVARAQRFNEK